MRSAKCGVNLTLNGRARLLPSRILSANREIGKSASRETAANSDWRMVKRQRVANGDWRMLKRQFSGGQCYRTAEKNFSAHLPMRPPATKFWAHREVRPPKRRINSALIIFVINHWLKPVAWLVVGATSKFHATDFSP